MQLVLDGGKPMNVRSVNCEERILNYIEEDNGTNTSRIAAVENVGHIEGTPRTRVLPVTYATRADTTSG